MCIVQYVNCHIYVPSNKLLEPNQFLPLYDLIREISMDPSALINQIYVIWNDQYVHDRNNNRSVIFAKISGNNYR